MSKVINTNGIYAMNVDFVSMDGVEGNFYLIDNGVEHKICCDIAGFKGLDLCDADFITEEDIFLGNKDFQSLKEGDCISVLNNAVIILEVDITSHSQFNEECERLEMQDWI